MTRAEMIASAKRYAISAGLDPALVCAVVEQESGWDTHAIRYEPGFYDRYIVPLALKSATESRGRAFSWGLMQVMGQVAREHGFDGEYLSELCEPDNGLAIGCRVLKAKLARFGFDTVKGLLAWNGGARREYPEEVLQRMSKYK